MKMMREEISKVCEGVLLSDVPTDQLHLYNNNGDGEGVERIHPDVFLDGRALLLQQGWSWHGGLMGEPTTYVVSLNN